MKEIGLVIWYHLEVTRGKDCGMECQGQSGEYDFGLRDPASLWQTLRAESGIRPLFKIAIAVLQSPPNWPHALTRIQVKWHNTTRSLRGIGHFKTFPNLRKEIKLVPHYPY